MDPISGEMRIEIDRVIQELRDHGCHVEINDSISLFEQLVFLLTVLHNVLGKAVAYS